MSPLPPGIELRTAGPDDRDAVVALLHEQMSSRISLERWRRLFDYPWLADKPDCGVVVLERGRVAGYLGGDLRRPPAPRAHRPDRQSQLLVHRQAAARAGARPRHAAARDPRPGRDLHDLQQQSAGAPPDGRGRPGPARREPLPLAADRRAARPRSRFSRASLRCHPRYRTTSGRSWRTIAILPVQPHLLRAADGDCLVVLSVKHKGADVAYHEVLHLGRPDVLARHAQAFANPVLAPGDSVLAVDQRFLDGCEVSAESEPISVPRYFRSPDLARREVDFLYSEIPLLDLKLY